MKKPILLAAAILLAVAAAPARLLAEEQPVQLKKAPGLETVESNCGTCHSLDYVQMNSPFPDGKLWTVEVTKMIKTFGALIDDNDAKAIIEYLSKNYGS